METKPARPYLPINGNGELQPDAERRTPNPRHRHRRPQKRTLTIKKRTIKCRPFLVALFATPFHFFHPAPSPIIPLLPIYLIIPIYLSHWVSKSGENLDTAAYPTGCPRACASDFEPCPASVPYFFSEIRQFLSCYRFGTVANKSRLSPVFRRPLSL